MTFETLMGIRADLTASSATPLADRYRERLRRDTVGNDF
jgi:hypothetical protein